LKEELGAEEFNALVAEKINGYIFSDLARALVQRPNLQEELGEAFNNFMSALVKKAVERPHSDLAIALAQRAKLKAELRAEDFNNFMRVLVAEKINGYIFSDLARALVQRPNLQEELGGEDFTALVAKVEKSPDLPLASALAQRANLKAELAIPMIDSKFLKLFNKLEPNVQNQFGTWLNTIFTQVLPKDIALETQTQIRTEALTYFPQAIRAKIQAGLLPEQAV
jgi:hypothetical protein